MVTPSVSSSSRSGSNSSTAILPTSSNSHDDDANLAIEIIESSSNNHEVRLKSMAKINNEQSMPSSSNGAAGRLAIANATADHNYIRPGTYI